MRHFFILLVSVFLMVCCSCTIRQTEIFSQSMVLADGVTTTIALYHGGFYETNPNMPKTAEGSMLFTAAVMVANHFLGNYLERKKPNLGKVWFIGLGVAKSYAVGHNIYVLSKHYHDHHYMLVAPVAEGH